MSLFHHYNFQFNSNNCNEKSIFVALETGKRSGMEFIPNALAQGAKIIISQKPVEGMSIIRLSELTSATHNANIIVKNSLAFVQNLAKQKFEFLKENGTKTIAITGSVGKTTTKEIMACTFSQYGNVHATYGNYNNNIGLPFTILNAPNNIDFLILEMGMNHKEEIKLLTEIASCQWNIITTITENHSGNFTNGKTGVLRAKFEIMYSGGICFTSKEVYDKFLRDDTLTQIHDKENIIPVECNPDIDSNGFLLEGRYFPLNRIYSGSQVKMFCIAIKAMESILEKKIKKIIVPEIKGRGNVITWSSIKIINESYNASPSSMKNALENFQKYKGRKLCILGDMLELGQHSTTYHKELIPYVQQFSSAILVGSEMNNIHTNNGVHFQCYTEVLTFLKGDTKFLQNFDCILVKSSHGINLWKLFDDLFI